MINSEDIVFWGSLAGLSVLSVIGFAKEKNAKQFLFGVSTLGICGIAYLLVFSRGDGLQSKGSEQPEIGFVVVLYVCMLFGIASHYFYDLLVTPRLSRPPFDIGALLAPMLASPLVFIPLLGAFQSADIDLANLTRPKLMIFLVAFQNGFFWKEVFDNRRRARKTPKI